MMLRVRARCKGSTYKEFMDVIKEILSGEDIHEKRRQELAKQFYYYQTGSSCNKIFELIDGWNEKHQQEMTSMSSHASHEEFWCHISCLS